MKRLFLMMLSVVFFVSSAIAQLPRAQMQQRLSGKVEQAAQKATVKNLQEARSRLAIAYLSGMFGVVDEILTQYPELVNETIKDKDGKSVPMVYHAFAQDKRYIKEIIQPIKKDLAKAQEKKEEWYWKNYYAQIDKDIYYFERMPMIITYHAFGDGHHISGVDPEGLLWYCLFFPMVYDVIAAAVNTVIGFGYSVYNGVRIVRTDSKLKKADRQVQSLDNQLEELKKQLRTLVSAPNFMLVTFYKHGAKCPRCFEESLRKPVSILSVNEAITLTYYLTTYGTTAEKIIEGCHGTNNDWEKILAITKEIRVTQSTLPKLVARTSNLQVLGIVLALATSDEPAVQQQIEEYRASYKEILSRYKEILSRKLDEPQDPAEIKVTFFENEYIVRTSKDVADAQEQLEEAYQRKVREEYLAFGKEAPKQVRTTYEKSVAQLKQAQTRLERANAQRSAYKKSSAKHKQALANILSTIMMFEGHLDVALKFMKRFPNTSIDDVAYITPPTTVGDVTFQIPVVKVNGKVYDARPETFGKLLRTTAPN